MSIATESLLSRTSRTSRVWPVYLAEALISVSSTLLMVSVFFYTKHRFGWSDRTNLMLAVGQGAMYGVGALLASRWCALLGSVATLIVTHAALVAVALLGWASTSQWMIAALLLAYALVSAAVWPTMEGLISRGVDAHHLSRRIGIYNLVWSGVGAIVMAVSGSIVSHWPAGVFVLPAIVNAFCVAILLVTRRALPSDDASAPAAHVEPEPELLRVRRVAMWLSRISMPATFVAMYSLVALMPSFPTLQRLDTTMQTVVGSTWLIARWLTFLVCGATTWWHTRPRLLLASAAVLVIAFAGVTIRPTLLSLSPDLELTWMILWQIALGIVFGIIFSGSLYFGMVLSEGATEHGGYHEALIGLGSILGPGAGALAQTMWPNNLNRGVGAVSAVLLASLVAATGVSLVMRREEDS